MSEQSDQGGRSDSNVNRRRFLTAAGAAGIAGIAGCSGGGDSGSGGSGGSGGSSGSGGSGGSGGGSTTTGSSSGSTVTIRLWSGNMTDEPVLRKHWENSIAEFNDQSNDVEVALRGVPFNSQFKKVRSALQAGSNMPHFVQIAGQSQMLQAGELLNLTEEGMWEQSKLSETIAESATNIAKVWGKQVTGEDDTLVTWSVAVRPHFNVYNRNWLDAAGVAPSDIPGTAENLENGTPVWRNGGSGTFSMFEDLYKPMNGTDLAAPDDAAPDTTAMKEADEEYISYYMGQWGVTGMGPVNNAATHSILDTEAARNAIRFQKEGVEQGYFHPNSINHGDEEATTLVWSNKIGMMHIQDVSDLWKSFRKQLGDQTYLDNYTWGVPPKAAGSNGEKSTFILMPSFLPFAKAYENQAQKDASVEFIDWFAASREQQLANLKGIGYVPTNPDVLKADWFTQDELHTKFWGVAKRVMEEWEFTVLPAIEGAPSINYPVPRKMHQRIMQQGMSVEKATKLASEEINQILKDNGRYEPR
ncbi:MAG: ABC transporter substrate-binding protein [Haloferacaceae archaeon]